MRRQSGRWLIACINWTHPDAPHALLARVGPDGCFDYERYYDTHADAVEALDEVARRATLIEAVWSLATGGAR